MHTNERIAVTGMGAVSALGLDLDQSWRGCREGRSGISIGTFDSGVNGPAPFCSPIAKLPGDPVKVLESRLTKSLGASLDSFAVFALLAAHEAIADSGLALANNSRKGVVMGVGMGGIGTLETSYERFFGRKSAKIHPLTIPKVMPSAPASAISMAFGIVGPVFSVSSACASSGHAIIQAALLIRSGLCDAVICGGSEAIASPGSLATWAGLRATSQHTCRPFSSGRDGMVVGEGAAVMVLEREEHATQRGAPVHAWLTGFGMSSDAEHWTQPGLVGATNSIRSACHNAGILEAESILVSAHGTGTILNDANEAAALNAVFGNRLRNHPVIATKSAHGHLIGATTSLQANLGIRALSDAIAPPIQNYLGPDPDIDLDLVCGMARPISASHLLVNAFAFGGLNVSLVFERAENGVRA